MALSVPIRLFRSDGTSVDSTTVNVSSDGFYCSSDGPFTVGEYIRCILALPSFDPVRREELVALDCRVRVVRVELLGRSGYGIGCSIEQYQVMRTEKKGLPQVGSA